MVRKSLLLGQVLTETGAVTPQSVHHALEQQRQTGQRLGEVLVSLGLVSPEDVAAALGRQLGLEFVGLPEVRLPLEVLSLVPEELARRHRVIPVRQEDSVLVLGMVDPLDVVAIDDVRRSTGFPIRPAIVTADGFFHAVGQYARSAQTIERILGEIRVGTVPIEGDSVDQLRIVAEQAPIVRLVDQMITQAVRRSASDIHIEPQEDRLRIRYRLDGVLHAAMMPSRHIQPAVVSRVKIMSRLDIAERRLPQDGRMEVHVDERNIDFRVSTIPTIWGEKVALRILDKSRAVIGVERLGLPPEDYHRFEALISKPHGILLLTGPTGSGKTTTLYAALNRLNHSEVNITTIEDPVEYQLPGVNQVQINPRAGVTFASGLRAFLRQDPNIIMVGEIRDEETARMTTHAALTGHLVLSTLHTNDAVGAITRLVDMGIEPFLVASSLVGVIAQRLVRVLCLKCRELYKPTKELQKTLGLTDRHPRPMLYQAKGCEFCHYTGYKGRTAIFEIMVVDDVLKNLIVRRASSSELKEAALAAGMRTLRDAGLVRILDGTTTWEEVLRVVFVEDEA